MQHLHNRLWGHRYSSLGLMQHLHNRLWWHRYSSLGLMQHWLWNRYSCSTLGLMQHWLWWNRYSSLGLMQHWLWWNRYSSLGLMQHWLWWHHYSTLGLMQHLHNRLWWHHYSVGLPMGNWKWSNFKSVMLELNIYLSCIKATQAVCEQSYFFDHSSLGLERVKIMVKISSSDFWSSTLKPMVLMDFTWCTMCKNAWTNPTMDCEVTIF